MYTWAKRTEDFASRTSRLAPQLRRIPVSSSSRPLPNHNGPWVNVSATRPPAPSAAQRWVVCCADATAAADSGRVLSARTAHAASGALFASPKLRFWLRHERPISGPRPSAR